MTNTTAGGDATVIGAGDRTLADHWADVRGQAAGLSKWTDKATQLAADAVAAPRPSWWARRRGRRLAGRAAATEVARATATKRATATASKGRSSRIRYVAPVAALGTAAVLQVAVMTDTFGGKLAAAMADSANVAVASRPWLGYVAGVLLGLAVAACAEGGAAHLMDLYDKHLLARDSTGLLRLGMLAYVAGSAALIHWWLAKHHFPTQIAWALAAMTGSSLFLWSRTSRWKHRAAMRDAGQLDPALVRLPLAAKLLHPFRWAVTLYLVSWEPAATTDEARQRFEDWAAARRGDKAVKATTADAARWATEDHSDPWDRAVPVGDLDPDADLAAWNVSGRGRAEVATARAAVATKRATATYDRDAAKATIRCELDLIDMGLPARAQGEARKQIDVAVAAEFDISERTARKLRSEITGEPVSGPPASSA